MRPQEYQYAEQLDTIPEEDGEEQQDLVKSSRTIQHRDDFVLKPMSQSSTIPSEDIVSNFDARTFHRSLTDMLHGSPISQDSCTASSCTQVDDDDDHTSPIDEVEEFVEDDTYEQRLRRGPSFTESEVEEWYAEQPEHGPKSVIQCLSTDLGSQEFNKDACVLFLNMEKDLNELQMKHSGSSDLIEEAKWRLASIMKEMCKDFATGD